MEDVKEEDKTKAKELFEKDLGDKPKEMRDKILEGKLSAYFGEKVLLEQAFIKNPEVKIGSLIEQAVQKFGERTEIGRFVRFSIK
jgi:elongation factor Ts